jgi:glycosyltransferase involved in cell wall biosynthesis
MQKELPYVSVLLCVFNGGNHLSSAIDSILNQTFRDFEFILIDDGSTDNTWQVITNYAIKDSRIRAFKQKNIGLTKSLNRGLELCRGEFIARQDADDISDVNRLKIQVAASKHCSFLFARSYKLGTVVPNSFLLKFPVSQLLLTGNVFIHGTLFVRANLLKKYRYEENYQYAQDFNLCVRMIKDGHIPCFIRAPLYTLGVSDGQISKRNADLQNQFVLKTMKENFIETKYYSLMLKVRVGALRNMLRVFFLCYLSIRCRD